MNENAKVTSISKVTVKDGSVLNRVFAVLADGTVGNFYCAHNFKVGDIVEFYLTLNNECKFVVRPVIPH